MNLIPFMDILVTMLEMDSLICSKEFSDGSPGGGLNVGRWSTKSNRIGK